MGKVHIPYYVVVKGFGYWRPKPAMRALGFERVACGKDGPAAWAVAQKWAERWEQALDLLAALHPDLSFVDCAV